MENSVLPVDCEGQEDREPGDPHVEVEEGEEHVRQPPHVYIFIKRCRFKRTKEENTKNGGKMVHAIWTENRQV